MTKNPVSTLMEDSFMIKFKYYKSLKPNQFCTTVISVVTDKSRNSEQIKLAKDDYYDDTRIDVLGLRKPQQWKIFTFYKHPGLILIRNPFTSLGQRYWIQKCLEEYPKKPNKLNIDIDSNLQNWWSESHRNGYANEQLLKKLRWTTLGYHHNWDTKVYKENEKTPFPEDLAELSDVIAEYIDHSDFRAEAAIVNYYNMNSTLSAHTDHSEANLEAPLFSFSFGQSAIFLLGGRDKTVVPSAIQIDSGDIIVMSKEARLCYHAVPKIMKSPLSPWNDVHSKIVISSFPDLKYIKNAENMISLINENASDVKWFKFANYVQEHRINMNVRQVLKWNQSTLCD